MSLLRIKPPSSRILSGPEAVKAATALRALVDKHELWPYDWLFQPKNGKPIAPFATIQAPAPATTTTILDFQVPTGFNFAMVGILTNFTGSGFIPGAGNALWDTILNPATQNLPIQGLGAVPFNMGSFDDGWWRFPATYVFVSLDIIRNQVTTTADIAQGAPNYFTTIYEGWLYPSAEETKLIKK
jgi:hypothetical protein